MAYSRGVIFARIAGFLGFVAVGLGAFGTHALRGRLTPGDLDIWRTGTFYHLVHAVALAAVALAGARVRARTLVCGLWTAGIGIFAGSLYLLALTKLRFFGAITPVGGVALLGGWLVLGVTKVIDGAPRSIQ
jgi:uncharacterized membrane protein YgdD (TMEM256/DUF423 family)